MIQKGAVAVNTLPHTDETTPPTGWTLVDLITETHAQLGAPVTSLSTLLLGLHLLGQLDDATAGTGIGLGGIDAAAGRIAQDEATPPAGAVPGMRPTALDDAVRRFGRNVAAPTVGLPQYNPSLVERVAHDLNARGVLAREAKQAQTYKPKTKTYTGPKAYQRPDLDERSDAQKIVDLQARRRAR